MYFIKTNGGNNMGKVSVDQVNKTIRGNPKFVYYLDDYHPAMPCISVLEHKAKLKIDPIWFYAYIKGSWTN